MNLFKLFHLIILFCVGYGLSALNAAKIDGQTSVVVQSTSYDFDADDSESGSGVLSGIGAVGAVWFQSGFTLYDDPIPADTELSVVFPVHGTISMNSGTLTLLHDLTLGSDASISGTGTIKGESNVLKLSNDLSYDTNTLTVATSITVDGANHQFVLAAGGTISVAASQTLTLKNMDFVWLGTLTMGAGSTLILDNVRMHMNSDETLSAGALKIQNSSLVTGPSGTTLTFSSSDSFTINSDSMLTLDDGITFKYSNASATEFVFTDETSCLSLIGATLETTTAATQLKKGVILVDSHSYVKGSGSGTFAIGGSGSDDINIRIKPGGTIDSAGGANTYVGS